MNMRLCPARLSLAVVVALSSWATLRAQEQPTFLLPVEMKGQRLRGSIAVAQHENDPMAGVDGKNTEAGYKVESVSPGGPAQRAGIQPGDVILSADGSPMKDVDDETWKSRVLGSKKARDVLNLVYSRNGETKTASVVLELRKNVLAKDPQWLKESKLPPAVAQRIFGGGAVVVAGLAEQGQFPSHVFLVVDIASKDAPPFVADDTKFFVLDGTGQQLQHVSLDEIRYAIQLSLAQNWRGGNYPPPPPPSPQPRYTIAGVESGNYTVRDLGGGLGAISGTSTGSYTVTPEPDYSQLGYSLGLAIRQWRDRKSNRKLLEQAQQAIASWERPYFKSQSLIVAGERRFGQIMYWTGSARKPEPPFRVVLFLTDPRSQKEEHVTFAFGPNAERIKEALANQAGPATAAPSTRQAPLTNKDVLEMVRAGLVPEIVVAKIKATTCAFDTSPTVLKELKEAGVPDTVILAMVQAFTNGQDKK